MCDFEVKTELIGWIKEEPWPYEADGYQDGGMTEQEVIQAIKKEEPDSEEEENYDGSAVESSDNYEPSETSKRSSTDSEFAPEDDLPLSRLIKPQRKRKSIDLDADFLPEDEENHPPKVNSDSGIDEKSTECEICGKVIARTSLNPHMKLHSGKKPFICNVKGCDKAFALPYYLQRHKLWHSQERNHHCPKCEKTFVHRGDLTVHLRSHLPSTKLPFKCQFCPKAFARSDVLRKHEPRHTGEKPFRCEDCGLKFSRKDLLKLHVQRHCAKGKGAIKCRHCPKKFASRKDLTIHLGKKHHGGKLKECPECGDLLATRQTLYQHMLIHKRGNKKLQCPKCPNLFAGQPSLKYHLKTIHARPGV